MLPIAPDTILQQRYRILNILEEGGLVRTYLATDRQRADAYCAIEELTPFSQFSSAVVKAKELFKQEATLLQRLDLPQLPHFWTTFEDQNRLFLVRDYIDGKTYGQILAEHRDLGTVFSESEVWQLLLKILPAIGYIHTQGVIHRDICPEHIVCRQSDGLPVLIDFGIVKEFANQLQAVPLNGGVSVGRAGYAPSEQIHSGRIYPHSDLYALAVTAIVLLTGKEPSALFESGSMNWDWRRWTQIDDRFANCLSKMLNPNPEDRYQSAAEVERDLRAVANPNLQPIDPQQLSNNRLSTLPTVAVGGKGTPAATSSSQTAITNLDRKSIWEKPQVFIPVGILISLLAGFGSWFGVSQLLHRESSDPVVTTPPKQIDFNNPTIPTDTSSPSPTSSDTIQPEMDRPIVKEGTVSTENPVKYRVTALAGQNLDIQLVSASSQTSSDSATSLSSPIPSISPSPGTTNEAQSQNPPISVPTMAATQVLMTIQTPAGSPIDDRADRVVGWRGAVPTSGEYTIELRPIQGLKGNAFPYKLSITQIAAIPSAAPTVTSTPIPDGTATPDATATPELPVPNGSGIDPTPTNSPSTNQSIEDGTPSSFPAPIPSVSPSPTPIETVRPTRNRRRNRTESSTSSTTRQRTRSNESVEESTSTTRRRRNRVESSDETTATPTTRRRRSRVESTDETTATPTRRRRRNRTTQATPQSSPSTTDSGNTNPSNTPSPEPSVGIPVPPAKTNTTPNSGVTDSE